MRNFFAGMLSYATNSETVPEFLEEELEKLRSNDSNYTELLLSSRRIGDAGVKAIATALKTNFNLKRLVLSNNNISDIGVIELAASLENNTTLMYLSISENRFTIRGLQAIANMLKKNKNIIKIFLLRNDIDDAGAKVLAVTLENNQNLKKIDISHNIIGNLGAEAIASTMKKNPRISWEGITLNKIEQTGFNTLIGALTNNTKITSYTLTSPHFGDICAETLANVLLNNLSLTHLNLSNCEITHVGAQAIAKSLLINATLTKLFLNYNKIGNEGANAIAHSLKENCKLNVLSIRKNEISNAGLHKLLLSLENNHTLTFLDLSSNYFMQQALDSLANLLMFNDTVTDLRLDSCYIGNEGVEAISSGLRRNRSLTRLDLGSNKIDDTSMKIIAQYLESNNCLLDFSLHGNSITGKGVQAIASSLKANNTLTSISLGANEIRDDGAIAIADLLRVNSTLNKVCLYYNKIGESGTSALGEALKDNYTITSIFDIGENESEILNKYLERNKDLLHQAYLSVEQGNLEKIKFYLKKKVSIIYSTHGYSRTALHIAVIHGRVAMAKFLVEQGSLILALDSKDRTAIDYANKYPFWGLSEYFSCWIEVLKLIKRNKNLKQALHLAITKNQLSIVQGLAAIKEIDLSEEIVDGNTALLLAVKDGHMDMAKWLVEEKKVSLLDKNNKGETVALLAAKFGDLEFLQWFVEVKKVSFLHKNDEGETAVLLAAKQGHLGILKWLVEEKGGNPLDINIHGYNALFLSLWNRRWEIVKWFLLESQIQINISKIHCPNYIHDNLKLMCINFLEICLLSKSSKIDFEMLLQKLILADTWPSDTEFRLGIIEAIFKIHMLHKQHYPYDCHTIIIKWINEFYKYQQNTEILTLAIKYGYLPIIKDLKINIKGVDLEFEKIDSLQADFLVALFQNNSHLLYLNFSDANFTTDGFNSFLNLLKSNSSKIERLNLSSCGLTDNEIISISNLLSQFYELKILNLSFNKISKHGFERIVEVLPLNLEKFEINNNMIDYKEARITLDHLNNIANKLSRNIKIDLSCNFIESSTHNKDLKNVLFLLLTKYNAQIVDILNSKFESYRKINDEEYVLSLIFSEDESREVKLSYREAKLITTARNNLTFQSDSELIEYVLSLRNENTIKTSLLKNNLFGKKENDHAAIQVCQELLDYHNYHPKIPPLKSYLRTHAFFKTSKKTKVNCLLLPKLEISLNEWMVYLIALDPKHKGIFHQHAWIAYEGLTNHGQRFFKVAQLTVIIPGFLNQIKNIVFGGAQPEISFFTRTNDNQRSTIETVEYLKSHCVIAGFRTERKNVKNLHRHILEEVGPGKCPNKYKTVISSSNGALTPEEKHNEVINCVKWAVDRIEGHLTIKIPDSCKGNYIPYDVVSSVIKLGEPVILPSTSQPSLGAC